MPITNHIVLQIYIATIWNGINKKEIKAADIAFYLLKDHDSSHYLPNSILNIHTLYV